MSHHVPGPPDYDVVMTEQVPGLNGPKMLGRHKPTAPNWSGNLLLIKTYRHPAKGQVWLNKNVQSSY